MFAWRLRPVLTLGIHAVEGDDFSDVAGDGTVGEEPAFTSPFFAFGLELSDDVDEECGEYDDGGDGYDGELCHASTSSRASTNPSILMLVINVFNRARSAVSTSMRSSALTSSCTSSSLRIS